MDVSNVCFNLYFHDGPYWLEVYKNDRMQLKIDCINDRKDRYSQMIIYCGYYDFLRCIYNTVKSFIKIYIRMA